MIKIINKALKSNFNNFGLTIISSSFTTQLQNTTYPYVFGGLKNVSFNHSGPSLLLINELFGNDTLEGFQDAYRFTLNSLAQREKSSLQNICQPNLTKNLTFRDVQLVNPDAKIDVVCGKSYKAFGATFIRESGTQLKLMSSMSSQDDSDFYLNMGMMNPSNPSSMMKYMSSGLPIVMGFEILFKSQMRLIPHGQRAEKVPQIHSLQFEIESKMVLSKYMSMAMKLAGGGKPYGDPSEAKTILKEIIGNDFEWKIGDIDRALKRNLKIVS